MTDHVVLMCHGDANGLVLPELGPEVAAEQPFNGSISPAQLRASARLDGRPVLSSGCSLGTPRFVAACARGRIATAGLRPRSRNRLLDKTPSSPYYGNICEREA